MTQDTQRHTLHVNMTLGAALTTDCELPNGKGMLQVNVSNIAYVQKDSDLECLIWIQSLNAIQSSS